MENLVTIFIGISAVAIVIQMGILIALYVSVKKTTDAMNANVEKHAVPALIAARSLLDENGPKMTEMLDNALATSRMVKAQMQRLDATVTDVVDRARLQVIRADELVTRTIDRVEETTDIVHHTVISPVRQVAGIVQGISAGAGWLLGRARKPSRAGGPEDEMFI